MNALELDRLVEKYDNGRVQLSDAYEDGGFGSPWPRFKRAAMNNSMGTTEATPGRYGIWANTVRDNAHRAYKLIEEGRPEEALPALVYVINSLFAFADVQKDMDPMS